MKAIQISFLLACCRLKSWLSYDDLSTYFSKNKSRHLLVGLDACYSGAFGDRWKGKLTSTNSFPTSA